MYVLYFKYLFIREYALIICGDADGVAVTLKKNEILDVVLPFTPSVGRYLTLLLSDI